MGSDPSRPSSESPGGGFHWRGDVAGLSFAPMSEPRTAIIVENFGGPQSAEEVEPFLFNLFNDPDVIHLPFGPAFQAWLARRVSKKRAPAVIPEYARMGGGSPLVPVTMQQAAALEAELKTRQPADAVPPIYVGMRYTAPFIADAVKRALDDGAQRLVALPLFPHYSLTTTGSVHNAVAQALEALGRREVPVSYVPAFFDHPGWVEAVVARIGEALAGPDAPARPALLFSAHGLPSRYVRKGDPYMGQVQESVRLIVDRLGWTGRWGLGWQSRVGPLKWLDPSTDLAIERLLREEGEREILVVPIAFVGDHIETLVEIGHTYREQALAQGASWFEVTRGLDTHPAFIACLADLVARAQAGAYDRLCFRCLLPRERQHLGRAQCLDCKIKRPYYDRVWRTRQDLERGL